MARVDSRLGPPRAGRLWAESGPLAGGGRRFCDVVGLRWIAESAASRHRQWSDPGL